MAFQSHYTEKAVESSYAEGPLQGLYTEEALQTTRGFVRPLYIGHIVNFFTEEALQIPYTEYICKVPIPGCHSTDREDFVEPLGAFFT